MGNFFKATDVPPEVAEAIKAKQELRKAEQAAQRFAAVVLRARGELETATDAREEKIAEQAVAEAAYRLALQTLQKEQARDSPQTHGNKIVIDFEIFETADPDDMDDAEKNTFTQ
ncbi:unnamed protein product [Prorocentrum cordatum]|uniref:Prohibitin n=1 Tax=Prorocentrum cordatum TaxID=2364126 RepID=A0ABN9RSU0_9DINO|nr:unnamed protein product [Polarella glacialis]